MPVKLSNGGHSCQLNLVMGPFMPVKLSNGGHSCQLNLVMGAIHAS